MDSQIDKDEDPYILQAADSCLKVCNRLIDIANRNPSGETSLFFYFMQYQT